MPLSPFFPDTFPKRSLFQMDDTVIAGLYPEGNSMPIFDSYNAAIPHLSNPYNTPEAVLRTSYCHFPHILCNGWFHKRILPCPVVPVSSLRNESSLYSFVHFETRLPVLPLLYSCPVIFPNATDCFHLHRKLQRYKAPLIPAPCVVPFLFETFLLPYHRSGYPDNKSSWSVHWYSLSPLLNPGPAFFSVLILSQ